MANKNIRGLSARKELNRNLFEETSQKARDNEPDESFKELAKDFRIDNSVVYGTASFYDFTRKENRNKEIFICNGTACMTAGTQEGLKTNVTNHINADKIGHASCLGHCHSNSAFMYADKTYTAKTKEEVQAILSSVKESNNSYYVGSNTKSILTGAIADVTQFYDLANGFLTSRKDIIQELKRSNLRGRGGAGFPFWFKLDAVFKEKNEQKYIVCNADEGDPGAYSDMYLMENQAHKVLFGMYISGIAVGADTGVLYIRGEYPESIRAIEQAIKDITTHNLAPNFRFKIIRGQGSYVCGEETALLSSIEGMRPEVRVRPPYPAQYGLYGKPTLLSNVETFANIHWILKNGGAAYASLGTEKSTGTKLVSLDSFFNRPGVYEIEMGTSMSEVVERHGKGFKNNIKAVQVGGPLGGIIPVKQLKNLTLDFESLDSNGFLLGHASFVSIPEGFPMIQFIEHLLKFTADESCGKCYPCRIGSFRGYEMVEKAQEEDYKIDKQLFNDLLETLEIGSLCALGGGVPLPIKNAIQYFDNELKFYFK